MFPDRSAPMKMKYRGAALSVLFVTRKCALSCCGRVGESKVTKGTVSPPNPAGKGGTSAMHAMLRLWGPFFSMVVHVGMCSVFVRRG